MHRTGWRYRRWLRLVALPASLWFGLPWSAAGATHERARRPRFTVPEALAGPTNSASDTLRLSAVLEEALEANPALIAARWRAGASTERVTQAGAFPEPMLSFGLMNRPVDGFGGAEPMTMNQVEVMQRVPWFGVRSSSRAAAGGRARADALDVEEQAAMLGARIKEAYVRLGWLDRVIAVEEGTRERLRDLLTLAESRYAVGEGTQRDLLQAQVAIARSTADLQMHAQERLAAAARLNALRGKSRDEAVEAVEFPDPGAEPAAAEALLARAMEWRPSLRSARARSSAAQAERTLADRAFLPEWTLRIGYGQRPRFGDMATLMVGVSLPVWPGQRQRPLQREADAMLAGDRAVERELETETYARLMEVRSLAERARSLERLYRSSMLPQAAAAVESSLAAFQVGRVDYDTLLNDQTSVSRLEIERLGFVAEYWTAMAALEALAGPQDGENR